MARICKVYRQVLGDESADGDEDYVDVKIASAT
jgi:hypothetical protein